jgi:Uncharacterized low-complexity proteins
VLWDLSNTKRVIANVTWIAESVDGAEYDECVFDRCTFSGSSFTHCRFLSCRFVRCDLSNLTVTATRFRDARFESTKLIGVDWTKADAMAEPHTNTSLSFTDCVLDLSNFVGLNLRAATFERCHAIETDFAEADLRDAVFRRTDLSGARFHNSNLERADFRDALNYTIDPRANKMRGARFNLPEAVALLRGLDVVVE